MNLFNNVPKHLFAHGRDLWLLHRRLRDDISKGTARQKLHDDPKRPLVTEAVDKIDQIFVIQFFQNLENRSYISSIFMIAVSDTADLWNGSEIG